MYASMKLSDNGEFKISNVNINTILIKINRNCDTFI